MNRPHGAAVKLRNITGEFQNMIDRAAGCEAAGAPEFETKRQLAARLGVSTRTIDNLLARGLPHLKLTRKLTRFPRAAVDEWLHQKEIRRG